MFAAATSTEHDQLAVIHDNYLVLSKLKIMDKSTLGILHAKDSGFILQITTLAIIKSKKM